MSELSIKVIIAGRTYPLTIDREEEQVVRAAANQINEAIKALQESYAVRDSQDLLAMAALQLVIKGSRDEPAVASEDPETTDALQRITAQLNEALNA